LNFNSKTKENVSYDIREITSIFLPHGLSQISYRWSGPWPDHWGKERAIIGPKLSRLPEGPDYRSRSTEILLYVQPIKHRRNYHAEQDLTHRVTLREDRLSLLVLGFSFTTCNQNKSRPRSIKYIVYWVRWGQRRVL